MKRTISLLFSITMVLLIVSGTSAQQQEEIPEVTVPTLKRRVGIDRSALARCGAAVGCRWTFCIYQAGQ